MPSRAIGAHVSIQGGIFNAPIRAKQLKANAMAIFVKNQRRWQDQVLGLEEIKQFQRQLADAQIECNNVLVHSGYLINLGSPKSLVREHSIGALIDELKRCSQLGLTKLVLHPGSHLNQMPIEQCLQLIANGINIAFDQTKKVKILLENTAGQGSNLGYNFEQIAYIIKRVTQVERLGVCLDTCHLWASGYDLSSEEGYQLTWQSFEQHIGWAFLQGMHINDSKGDCGSHLDRHASLGVGTLGTKTFMRLLQDTRLIAIPWILETPNSELWPQEIDWLKTHG